MQFYFDNPIRVTVPDPTIHTLIRVNKLLKGKTSFDPLFWGAHSTSNRFSVPGTEQLYLATSLATLSEATPWRDYVGPSVPLAKRTPIEERHLQGYYVSYIVPRHRITLLDVSRQQARYNLSLSELLDPKDKTVASEFAKAVRSTLPTIGGIMYPSQFDSGVPPNIVIFDNCKTLLTHDCCVGSIPLIDVVRPMTDLIQEQTGVLFKL